MSDWTVNAWLRKETPRHTALLAKLRERLERTLDRWTDEDGITQLPDVNEHGTPSRDWCRAYQRYAAGYATLLSEERERAKLQLMARLRGNGQVLTDEEFESGMRELAMQAVKELPTADLAQELMRRGLTLPSTQPDDEEAQ